jgi:hypothetical protein
MQILTKAYAGLLLQSLIERCPNGYNRFLGKEVSSEEPEMSLSVSCAAGR